MNTSKLIEKYFRTDNLPHLWCPGCSLGIATRALCAAVDELGLDKDKIVIVSGIGCSSRAVGYLDFNTIHTTHGRALAFATGVKLAKPELEVIVISGDGDASAIGGNHLIHAARRNIDLTLLVFNNSIYGMTGGQASPSTPQHAKGTTAPYGVVEQPFDLVKLAEGAGATYVARATAYHVNPLIKYYKNAIAHKGFGVVETICICPTYYGRQNRSGSAVEMMQRLKEDYVLNTNYEKMPEEQRQGKKVYGEFVNKILPEYIEEFDRIIADLKGETNV